jgi:hypothetical protein
LNRIFVSKPVELSFKRNNSIYGIIIPILAIFFLLGGIFIFEPKPDNIGNRLTLTLGIFALMFSLPEIIKTLKPEIILGPTIADTLVSIIVIATISYTVSSVIGTKLGGRRRWKKWLKKWVDTIVFVFVSIYVIISLLFNEYSIGNKLLVGSIVILGLGYGLLLQKALNILPRLHSVMNYFKSIGSKLKGRYKHIES